MSMSYWMIFGIGFEVADLMPYLDPEKIRQGLADKQIRLNEADLAKWDTLNTNGRIELLEEYVDSNFGFTDLMAESDEKDLLSCGNDGDNGRYLYYEPSYPWQKKEHECELEASAREHLCNVVMPFVLDDTPREDVLGLIYEINQVGMG